MLLAMSLSGCMFWASEEATEEIVENTYPSIWERYTLEWQTNDTMSYLLEEGPYHALDVEEAFIEVCLLYTSPSPRDRQKSRMPSSA